MQIAISARKRAAKNTDLFKDRTRSNLMRGVRIEDFYQGQDALWNHQRSTFGRYTSSANVVSWQEAYRFG